MQDQTRDFVSYLFQTQNHIHENIKFADQKAVAFITLNSGVVGVLYAGNLFLPRAANLVVTGFSIAAFSLLLVSIGLASAVLWPYGVELQKILIRSGATSRYRKRLLITEKIISLKYSCH
jgi:hypothetical protein